MVALAGCSLNTQPAPTSIPDVLLPTATASIEFTPCEEPGLSGFECGSIRAPLDYDNPDVGTIEVSVARARATKETKGVLMTNPGGPGASGRDFLPSVVSMLSRDVLASYDVVAVDPRGAGATAPVRCGTDLDSVYALDPTPETPAEMAAISDADRKFSDDCVAAAGHVLPHISTWDSAKDMDAVREALGVEKLAYLGFSYGTELGAAYIGLFPDRVERFVLDGPVDVSLDPASRSLEQGKGFELALDEFFSWCSRTSCALSPNPEKRFLKLSSALDEQPLPNKDRVSTNQAILLFATATALYSTAAYPMLSEALSAAEDGDGSLLLRLYDIYMERSDDGSYGSTQYAFRAISEADFEPLTIEDQEQLLASAKSSLPRFYPLFSTYPHENPWPSFPRPSRDGFKKAPAGTTLVVAATKDPATPISGGEALSRLLSAPLLIREGADHTSYSSSSCVKALVDSFFLAGTLPKSNTRCA